MVPVVALLTSGFVATRARHLKQYPPIHTPAYLKKLGTQPSNDTIWRAFHQLKKREHAWLYSYELADTDTDFNFNTSIKPNSKRDTNIYRVADVHHRTNFHSDSRSHSNSNADCSGCLN